MPLTLLANAGKSDSNFKYLLSEGDLCQMSSNKEFLQRSGFKIGQVDVYPALQTEKEYIEALNLFYIHRVNGWWNYRRQFVEYGICTDDEFKGKFGTK